jgi:hypothetical protein
MKRLFILAMLWAALCVSACAQERLKTCEVGQGGLCELSTQTPTQFWSRSTSTLHGGEIELGAMADTGSVLDFWIDCNTVSYCLVDAPQDQSHNRFTQVAWKCPHPGNCAHYRLKVLHQNQSFESVMALTEEIGNSITYSVVMTGTLGH